MIYKPEKAKYSILKEFKDIVLDNVNNSEDLIDNNLKPYAEAYQILKDAKFISTQKSEEINYYISWLNRADNYDWYPAAMQAIVIFKNDADKLLQFFEIYEQITAYLHLTAKVRNLRIEKYAIIINVLKEYDRENIKFDDLLNNILLKDNEKEEFIQIISSNIYIDLTARRRNYLILRLDSFISDRLASYKTPLLTIEHVLPQKLNDTWDLATWDEFTHKKWLHKLANLVPLSQRRNSKASNYDFNKKKNAYFKGSNGVTHYVLTNQIIQENEWTPEVLEKRQNKLLEVLKENWKLN